MTVYLGVLAHEQGRYDKAHRLLSQSLALSRQTGDLRMISFAVNFLARTALVLGRAAEMKAPLEEVYQFAIRVGDRYSTGLALERLAAVEQAIGEIEEAHRHFDQSANLYQTIGDAWSLTRVLNLQGWFALAQGWREHAWEQFKLAFEIAASAQIAGNALDALVGIAELSAGTGDPELGLTWLFISQIILPAPRRQGKLGSLARALEARPVSRAGKSIQGTRPVQHVQVAGGKPPRQPGHIR